MSPSCIGSFLHLVSMQARLCNSPRLSELLTTRELTGLINGLARQRCPLRPEHGEEPLTRWQLEAGHQTANQSKSLHEISQ